MIDQIFYAEEDHTKKKKKLIFKALKFFSKGT